MNNIDEATSKLDDIGNQLLEAWEGASGSNAYNALQMISTGIKNL